jgi:hypothetical protein
VQEIDVERSAAIPGLARRQLERFIAQSEEGLAREAEGEAA